MSRSMQLLSPVVSDRHSHVYTMLNQWIYLSIDIDVYYSLEYFLYILHVSISYSYNAVSPDWNHTQHLK